MPWPRRTPAEAPLARGPISLSPGPALALVAAGILLALVGLTIVGAPLAVPGLALAVLGALSVIVVAVNLLSARIDGEALSATVLEGQPLRVVLTVHPPKLLSLSAVALEHPLLAEAMALEPGRSSSVTLSVCPDRRGRFRVPAPALSISDPFGLVHGRQSRPGDMGELLVLPRIEPVRWHDDSVLGGASSAAWTAAAGTEVTDLAGLRDYQPGTPATRIHWPALARGSGLLERVFENDDELAPLVLIDPRGARDAGELSRLDALVRAIASLSVELARAGGVDLLLPARATTLRLSPSLSTWPALHRALALVELAPLHSAPPRCPADRRGILFYACTRPQLAAPAQRRWAGETLTLCPDDPGAVGGERLVLSVAGCAASAERVRG